MTKILRDLTQIESVGPGSTFTIRMPLGRTYHQVMAFLTNIPYDKVTNLQLQINGVVAQTWADGNELRLMREFKGLPNIAGVLTFDFEREGLISMANRVSTVIGTGDTSGNGPHATIVQITGELASDVVNPQIKASARTSGPSALGFIRKKRRFMQSASGAGEIEISDIPRNNIVEQIAIDMANVDVTRFELEMDGVTLFEGTPELYDHISNSGIRVPQADWLIVDFSSDGFGDRLLNATGSQDFRLKLTCAGAGQIPVIVDYLGGLGS